MPTIVNLPNVLLFSQCVVAFWAVAGVTCQGESTLCDHFSDLRIVHPARGAFLPSPSSFPSVLLEIALARANGDFLPNRLPSIVNHREELWSHNGDNGCGTVEIIVDGQLWGSANLLAVVQEQGDAQPRGGSAAASPRAPRQCQRRDNPETKVLEERHREALLRFQASEFGSPEAIQHFRTWSSLADQIAELSGASCHAEGDLSTEENEGESRNAAEGEVEQQDAGGVRMVQVKAGSVWDEPGLPEAVGKLWATLEIRGMDSGVHDIRVQFGTHEPAQDRGRGRGLEDTVQVRVMTAEEEGALPVGSAVLHHGQEGAADASAEHDRGADALKKITLCVLAGFPTGARETLMNSMRTWVDAGLLHAVGETIIFLQELMESDFVALPREVQSFAPDEAMPSMRIIGASSNVGIGRAMWELVEAARTEFVIFLEDDWILPYGEPKWQPLLAASMALIRSGRADVVRLKSDELSPQMEGGGEQLEGGYQYVLNCGRFLPPDAPHFFCACLDEAMARPEAWGGAPEDVFNDISLCHHTPADVDHDGPVGLPGLKVYCMPSRVCKYTNTPTIFQPAFFRTHVGPTAFVDPGIAFSKHFLEETVNLTWPLRPFVVGVPDSGLFGHVELDDKSPGGPLPTFH